MRELRASRWLHPSCQIPLCGGSPLIAERSETSARGINTIIRHRCRRGLPLHPRIKKFSNWRWRGEPAYSSLKLGSFVRSAGPSLRPDLLSRRPSGHGAKLNRLGVRQHGAAPPAYAYNVKTLRTQEIATAEQAERAYEQFVGQWRPRRPGHGCASASNRQGTIDQAAWRGFQPVLRSSPRGRPRLTDYYAGRKFACPPHPSI
jgi:hypothetical protein